MGKGNRSRNERYQDAYEMSGNTAVKAAPKKSDKDRQTPILIVAIALLLLVALGIYIFAASGVTMRNTVIVSSDNYEVTAAMMPYYENLSYSNMFQQYFMLYYQYVYGEEQQAYNAAASLMQGYTLSSFFNNALSTAKEVLVLCEEANKIGLTLDEEEIKTINESADSIENPAATFGTGVKKDDIRKAMELYTLAGKYSEKFTEDVKATATDADVMLYVDKNKAEYYSAEYLTYAITLKASDYTDDAEGFTAAKELADKYVALLEGTKNDIEFRSTVANYLVEVNFDSAIESALPLKDETTYAAEKAAAKEAINDRIIEVLVANNPANDEADFTGTYADGYKTVYSTLKTKIKSALDALSTSAAYKTDATEELDLWINNGETAEGEVKTIATSSETDYSKTVYMMTSPMALVIKPRASVAHILVEADRKEATEDELKAAKEKADSILEEYNATDKTLDSFKTLADKYNGPNAGFRFNDVTPDADYVEEFRSWAVDEERKAGDVGIVQSTFGYHIMYFISSEGAYLSTAKNGMAQEKYTALIESQSASLKLNEKAIEKYAPAVEEEQ